MPREPPLSVEQAERLAIGAGAGTLVIGAALALAPTRVGRAAGLTAPLGARLVGLADLALVPGLLVGAPRWPWVARRAGLNLVIAAYGARLGGRAGLLGRGLVAVTALDALVAARLRADEVG